MTRIVVHTQVDALAMHKETTSSAAPPALNSSDSAPGHTPRWPNSDGAPGHTPPWANYDGVPYLGQGPTFLSERESRLMFMLHQNEQQQQEYHRQQQHQQTFNYLMYGHLPSYYR